MKQIPTILLWLILLPFSGLSAEPLYLISADAQIRACESESATPPNFATDSCQTTTFAQLDPQQQSLWVQIQFDWSESDTAMSKPYGLYLFGKAASSINLNGQALGHNGHPALDAASERAGKMDSVFYIPESLLVNGNNQIVAQLSSHHGLLQLTRPMHLMAIATYGDPKRFVQQYSPFGLILLGSLLIGAVYFAALSLNRLQRPGAVYFLLLTLFAACQLAAEIVRGVISYDYPWHDLRLIAISLLSLGFGLTLLTFIAQKFSDNKLHWIYGTALVTLASFILAPGFDAKTTLATFIPCVAALTLLLYSYFRKGKQTALGYALVLLVFILSMLFGLQFFHEFIFYLLVTLLLCYLFIEQARELKREQIKRQAEQQQVAKLEYKLAQSSQQQTPEMLSITSAGKVDRISTADLCYCQAAGDYVELHLANNKQILYSGTMKSLEQQLPQTFLRVHRSYLVNLDKVRALQTADSQSKLLLDNQAEIPVSRRILPTVRSAVTN